MRTSRLNVLIKRASYSTVAVFILKLSLHAYKCVKSQLHIRVLIDIATRQYQGCVGTQMNEKWAEAAPYKPNIAFVK